MRTNIDIDDKLLAEAMKIAGKSSKKATVEEALRRMVRANKQLKALDAIRGTGWIGNLDEMREGRFFDGAS